MHKPAREGAGMIDANKIFDVVDKGNLNKEYAEWSWTGTYQEYLNMLAERPEIARTAFQRVYDMVASYGSRSSVLGAFQPAMVDSRPSPKSFPRG